MKLEMNQMSEVLKHFLGHLNLDKNLRKDPTDSVLWVEQSQYPPVVYWSLVFGIKLDPMNPSQMEQVGASLRALSDELEKSEWFKEREKVWDEQNKKLIEELKVLNRRVRQLRKYETHYNMQWKLRHG